MGGTSRHSNRTEWKVLSRELAQVSELSTMKQLCTHRIKTLACHNKRGF